MAAETQAERYPCNINKRKLKWRKIQQGACTSTSTSSSSRTGARTAETFRIVKSKHSLEAGFYELRMQQQHVVTLQVPTATAAQAVASTIVGVETQQQLPQQQQQQRNNTSTQ